MSRFPPPDPQYKLPVASGFNALALEALEVIKWPAWVWHTQTMRIRGTILHTPKRGQLEVLEDRVITTDSLGVILSVVPYTADCQPDIELDKSVVLLPGLVDAHIHASQWLQLGTGLDEPLENGFSNTPSP